MNSCEAKHVFTCQPQQQSCEVDVLWTPNYPKLGQPAGNTEQCRAERKDHKSWGWKKASNNFWSQSESCSSLFLEYWLSWDCLCLWWQRNGMYVVGRLHFWRLSFIQLMQNKKRIWTRGKEKLMGTMWFVCYSACRPELPPRAISRGHFTAGTVLSRLVIALSLHGRAW